MDSGVPDSVVATLDSCDRQIAAQQQQDALLDRGVGLLDSSARSAAAQQGQRELEKDMEQQRRRRQLKKQSRDLQAAEEQAQAAAKAADPGHAPGQPGPPVQASTPSRKKKKSKKKKGLVVEDGDAEGGHEASSRSRRSRDPRDRSRSRSRSQSREPGGRFNLASQSADQAQVQMQAQPRTNQSPSPTAQATLHMSMGHMGSGAGLGADAYGGRPDSGASSPSTSRASSRAASREASDTVAATMGPTFGPPPVRGRDKEVSPLRSRAVRPISDVGTDRLAPFQLSPSAAAPPPASLEDPESAGEYSSGTDAVEVRQQQQLYANYAGYGGLANDLRESQESAVSNSNVSEGGSHWFNSASSNAAGVGGSLTGSMSFEADDALAASRASWDFAAAAGAAGSARPHTASVTPSFLLRPSAECRPRTPSSGDKLEATANAFGFATDDGGGGGGGSGGGGQEDALSTPRNEPRPSTTLNIKLGAQQRRRRRHRGRGSSASGWDSGSDSEGEGNDGWAAKVKPPPSPIPMALGKSASEPAESFGGRGGGSRGGGSRGGGSRGGMRPPLFPPSSLPTCGSDSESEDEGIVSRKSLKSRAAAGRPPMAGSAAARAAAAQAAAAQTTIVEAEVTTPPDSARSERSERGNEAAAVGVAPAPAPATSAAPLVAGAGGVALSFEAEKSKESMQRAGLRLGFDLEGSLAAINKWSEEGADSDGEGDEAVGGGGGGGGGVLGAPPSNPDLVVDRSTGGDGLGRLPSGYSAVPRPTTRGNVEVVTRDRIIAQCAGPAPTGTPTAGMEALERGGKLLGTRGGLAAEAGHRDSRGLSSPATSSRAESRGSPLGSRGSAGIWSRGDMSMGGMGSRGSGMGSRGSGLGSRGTEASFRSDSEAASFGRADSFRSEASTSRPTSRANAEVNEALSALNSGADLSMAAAEPVEPASPVAKEVAVVGPAVSLSDAQLVDLLKRPPKHVSELRTREGYRRYFAGMPQGARRTPRHYAMPCPATMDKPDQRPEQRSSVRCVSQLPDHLAAPPFTTRRSNARTALRVVRGPRPSRRAKEGQEEARTCRGPARVNGWLGLWRFIELF